MKSLITWIKLTEGSAEDTTFFHEVICAIACYNPTGAAAITRGADIRQYFTDGTIVAKGPGAGEGKDINANELTKLPQFKFFDDSTIPVAVGEPASTKLKSKEASEDHFKDTGMEKRKTDAIQLANAIVKRIGAPDRKPVYWVGPTNDSTDYGAADIAYNGQGISLKYGGGQFKNLTVNQFARAALGKGKETELLKELHRDVPEKWDSMTTAWLNLIQKALDGWQVHKEEKDSTKVEMTRRDALTAARDLFTKKKNKTIGKWRTYQTEKMEPDEVQVFHDLLYISGKKSVYDKNDSKGAKDRVKTFRYVCRKIHDQGVSGGNVRPAWKKTRNDRFTDIFGTYFTSQDETIKKNLHTVFERQISVSEKPMLYAGKGGTDIRRVPSKAEFESAIFGIKFSYEGKTTGAGYTFILNAAQDVPGAKSIPIMKITIYFRWKGGGQMIGNPDTSSDSKMFVSDYTEVFPELE